MTPPQSILKGARALFGVAVLPLGSPVQLTPATVQRTTPLVRGTAFAVKEDRFLTASHVLPPDLAGFGEILLLGLAHSGNPQTLVRVSEVVARDDALDFALLKGSLVQGYMEPLTIEFRDPVIGEDIITVGRGPYAIAGAKDQKLLFVSNVLEDTIAVVDVDPASANRNRVVLRIGQPREP